MGDLGQTARVNELSFGQLIDGRYEVGEEIGRGAMGAVYAAEHTRLRKRVAIKVLHRELADDGDACERFEREARAASRVGSEHIVDVLDAGTLDDGRHYLVMEYLRGETLKAWLARLAPLDAEMLVPIIAQLCDGLAAAHDEGIVHRDVKPDNVFLVMRPGGEPLVKIVDFGVSKFRDVGTNALKSRTGVVLGTPHYMAPEQARGEREVDRRSDVFSAGIVLFEGLCGRRPFAAENVNQLLFRIALEDVPRVDDKVPGTPRRIADIVAKATARTPEARYQSARLFAADLRSWLAGEPESSGPRPVVQRTPAIDDEQTADATLASLPVGLVAEEVMPARQPKRAWIAGGFVAVAVAVWWVWPVREEPADTRPAEVAAPVPAPQIAPSVAPQPTLVRTVADPAPVVSTPPARPTVRPPVVRPSASTKPDPKTPRPIREAL